MPRTGNEPANARSPLGLRLALAGFGLVCGVAGLIGFAIVGWPPGELGFGALGMIAAVDVAVVLRHIRAGAHFQPGPDVPPYEPVAPAAPPRAPRVRTPAVVRRRRYLILMAICLTLLVLAWGLVRLFSTPLAVGMSLVAMVIPPIAAIVANAGGLPPQGGAKD